MTEHLIVKISDMDKQLSSLEKDQAITIKIVTKLEENVDRMKDIVESLNRLITIHDERIKFNKTNVEEQRNEMVKDIEDLKHRISETEDRILQKIEELERKFDNRDNYDREEKRKELEDKANKKNFLPELIDKWKWALIGAIFVLGLYAGKMGLFAELMKYF